MYCKVPSNGCIFVIPNSLFKIVLFVMLLSDSIVQKCLLVVITMLFCLSLGVMAQAEQPDSCKQKSAQKVEAEKSAKGEEVKEVCTVDKKLDKGAKKTSGSANIESILLFKHHAICKL